MSNALPQNNDGLLKSKQTLVLGYEGEDDQTFLVSNLTGMQLRVPKNRNVPKPFLDQPPQPLTPAFRSLALAFLGLAPAGLGTLVLAPLAALWGLAILISRPLMPGDRIRVFIVWGIAAALLGIAIPMSRLFLTRLSF